MFDTYITTTTKISEEKLHQLLNLNLPIFFKEDPESHYDEVGGFHSSAIGWNPNGVWCGECTKISCKDCSSRTSGGHYDC
jgi:hypothetical protein